MSENQNEQNRVAEASSTGSVPHVRTRPSWLLMALLALAGSAFFLASIKLAPNESPLQNGYVLQAEAFINGRAHIEHDEYVHDLAEVDGRKFVIHPPAPAVLLMPVVWLLGAAHTDTQAIGFGISILSLWVLWRIFVELKIDRAMARWLLAGFWGGSVVWFCVCWSESVYYFAHLVAAFFLLLAIWSALKGGWALAGLALAMAMMSRQLSVYATPFLLALLWTRMDGTRMWPRLLRTGGLLVCAGIPMLFYLWLNHVRFGHPLDTGYGLIPLQSFFRYRVEKFGQFHVAYLPFNFSHMFLQGFRVRFTGDEMLQIAGMSRFGTALPFASPFLFLALAARGHRLLVAAAAVSIVAALAHMLLYYNNGFVQHNGQRFTLDFIPIVMVLLALAVPRIPPALLKGLVVYAIIMNGIALVVVPFVTKLLTPV